MKKHYKRIKQELWFSHWHGEWFERWNRSYINAYELRWSYCYRYVKTFNEIKQNEHAKLDGYKVRGKRTKHILPTVWDDVRVSKVYGKSWKDFTKHRKQYMKNL